MGGLRETSRAPRPDLEFFSKRIAPVLVAVQKRFHAELRVAYIQVSISIDRISFDVSIGRSSYPAFEKTTTRRKSPPLSSPGVVA